MKSVLGLVAAFALGMVFYAAVESVPSNAVETAQEVISDKVDESAARSIIQSVRKGKWDDAKAAANKTSDPLARKIYQWLAYKDAAPGTRYEDILTFVADNPDWPMLDRLRLQAEKIIPGNLTDAKVIDWFKSAPPFTSAGMDRYAQALIHSGRKDEARKALRSWWENANLTRDQQKSFFGRYESYLDTASHKKRLDTLIGRGDYTNARAVARVLGNGYAELTEARIALARGDGNVNPALGKVPSRLTNDEGLLYERLRWRRRHDLNDGALEILAKEPAYGAKSNPAAWWQERNIMARRLMEEKKYKDAYDLVKNHHQKEGLPYAEAEWLAGWLALQFIKDPWAAFEHFENMYHKVETPISRARGAYWAGRASDALGHPEVARQWYDVAAKETGTFYGQLATAAVRRKPSLPPSYKNTRHIHADSQIAHAAQLLNEGGLRNEAAAFLLRLGKLSQNRDEYAAAADLADNLGQEHIAIRLAQDAAKTYGVTFVEQSYPSVVKDLKNVRDVEWALVHAVIRQESRFDKNAISPAGARGLMQLMPSTATSVARKLGVSHQTDWLTSRPEHNIRLGTRYLAQMLDRFDNNYALAAAAYNAGPNRVDEWLKEFGDPRKGDVNIVDWIEMIPFSETRNYVQRVLEGVYVYRLRLKDIQKESDAPIHIALHY